MFDVPEEHYIFGEIFRATEEYGRAQGSRKKEYFIRDLLLKFTAGRMRKRIWGAPKASKNVAAYWKGKFSDLEARYRAAELGARDFPISDWEDRLKNGNQYELLEESLKLIEEGKFQNLAGPFRSVSPTPSSVSTDDLSRYSGYSPEFTPAQQALIDRTYGPDAPGFGTSGSPARPTPSPPMRIRKRFTPVQDEKDPTQQPDLPRRPHILAQPIAMRPATPRPPSPQVEEDEDHEDFIQNWAQREEARIRRMYAGGGPMRLASRTDLVADVLKGDRTGIIQHRHLLQTDNNVQPVMGAVHMVSAGTNFHKKHFLFDVEGDINEGQKAIRQRARRGPFRDQNGRSLVMDQSAYVKYRKRGNAFEITVRRGVSNAEIQQLLSKLSTHRMSTLGSSVVLIKGRKKYRLGLLRDIDLRELLLAVEECITSYGACGLEITEDRAGSGALYKSGVHSARFKSAARHGKGPQSQRRMPFQTKVGAGDDLW